MSKCENQETGNNKISYIKNNMAVCLHVSKRNAAIFTHRIVNYKWFKVKHKIIWNEVHVESEYESEYVGEIVIVWKLQISTMTENYFRSDIFNGDEQGLFYHMMFKKFLIHVEEYHRGKES